MLKLESYNDFTLLVGRLFYSLLFLLSGYFKLTAYTATAASMAGRGLVPGELFAIVAIVFELGGGALMVLGYQTRCVALALAIYTLVAGLIAHTHWADTNQFIHFFKNMSIIGGSLAFVVSGAGAYSLDRRRS
jgi:putative oxidoreductase